MQSIFEASTYEAASAQIVHDVFETMLCYQVDRSCDEYAPGPNMVTAVVFFAGAWKGATVLECSRDQAFAFAGRLMGIPQPDQMDNDVRDSLGELANMIGGNLKSILPTGVGLSMPSVLDGSDYAFKICGANLIDRLSFRGELGPFWVTLVQMVERSKYHFPQDCLLRRTSQAAKIGKP
jgi:chemotaxis protein CheX